MKFGIAISAAFALTALTGVSAAEQISQSLVIKVTDQIGMYPPQGPIRLRHRFVHRPLYGLSPVACEAVIFPRSPLCAGRTASFGPYAPFPWNSYLYY
jgi:hypothetical protein